MTTAIYRYCSNPYSFPKLYSSARCEVLNFVKKRVKIRLLEFTNNHRPGDELNVMRKNIHILGLTQTNIDTSTIRLPYKDN